MLDMGDRDRIWSASEVLAQLREAGCKRTLTLRSTHSRQDRVGLFRFCFSFWALATALQPFSSSLTTPGVAGLPNPTLPLIAIGEVSGPKQALPTKVGKEPYAAGECFVSCVTSIPA